MQKLDQHGQTSKQSLADRSAQTTKQSLADRAVAYLESHYTDKFSLDEIAGALYVNKNYLARVFHKQTGQTLLQYHNRLRCEKACQLLTDRSYSISVVAFKTGFASASHFSRIFRIYEGCTPSQYRRMIIRHKTD